MPSTFPTIKNTLYSLYQQTVQTVWDLCLSARENPTKSILILLAGAIGYAAAASSDQIPSSFLDPRKVTKFPGISPSSVPLLNMWALDHFTINNTAMGYSAGFGDFDGDGKDDMAMSSSVSVSYSQTVTLRKGLKSGKLDSPSNITTIIFPRMAILGDVILADLNNDTCADLIAATSEGMFVFWGRKSEEWGWPSTYNASLADVIFKFPSNVSSFNLPAISANDATGDGVDDLLIVYPHSIPNTNLIEAGSLVFGHSGEWERDFDLENLNGKNGAKFFLPQNGQNQFGGGLIGKLSNNTLNDIIISVSNFQYGNFTPSLGQTVTYIIPGRKEWAPRIHLNSTTGLEIINDLPTMPNWGLNLFILRHSQSIGDNNGDGLPDLFVATPTNDKLVAFLLVGGDYPWFGSFNLSNPSPYKIVSFKTSLTLPTALLVANAGNINGDGMDSMLISGQFEETAYLIPGQKELPDIYDLSNLDGTDISVFFAPVSPTNPQSIVLPFYVGFHDLNNDGYSEALVAGTAFPPIYTNQSSFNIISAYSHSTPSPAPSALPSPVVTATPTPSSLPDITPTPTFAPTPFPSPKISNQVPSGSMPAWLADLLIATGIVGAALICAVLTALRSRQQALEGNLSNKRGGFFFCCPKKASSEEGENKGLLPSNPSSRPASVIFA